MPMPGEQGSDQMMSVTEVIQVLTELTQEVDFVDQPVVIEDQYGGEAHVTDVHPVNGVAFIWPSRDFEDDFVNEVRRLTWRERITGRQEMK